MDKLRRKIDLNTPDWWDERWGVHVTEYSRKFSDQIINMLQGYKILNIGAGRDNLAHRLSDQVTVFDISPYAREFQKEHGAVATYPNNNESVSAFADYSFDVVFASHVIEHLKNPTQALEEWCRIAKNFVLILCPHDDWANNQEEHLWKIHHDDFVHLGLLFGDSVTFFDAGIEICCRIDLRS